jgi:hypothetical protein
LGHDYTYLVKQEIATSLRVKRSTAVIRRVLVAEYEKIPGDELPRDRFVYKNVLGEVIGFLSKKQDLPDLLRLIRDPRHGAARGALIYALARKDRVHAGDVMLELVAQTDVLPSVIGALTYLRDPRASALAESLLAGPRPAGDKERPLRVLARRYLKRLKDASL